MISIKSRTFDQKTILMVLEQENYSLIKTKIFFLLFRKFYIFVKEDIKHKIYSYLISYSLNYSKLVILHIFYSKKLQEIYPRLSIR